MDAEQLKELIIEPTLQIAKKLYSRSATNLLLGTAGVETDLGAYIHQIKGPAKSIYQIEMKTHDYIIHRIELEGRIDLLFALSDVKLFRLTNEQNLVGNLYYATFIARLIYYFVPKKLPEHDDIEGLAKYWKKYYNTKTGKGRTEDFISKYHDLVKII